MEGCSLPVDAPSDEDREMFVHKCEQVVTLLPACQLPHQQDKLKVAATAVWHCESAVIYNFYFILFY